MIAQYLLKCLIIVRKTSKMVKIGHIVSVCVFRQNDYTQPTLAFSNIVAFNFHDMCKIGFVPYLKKLQKNLAAKFQ